jgi:hypothetical protein
MDVQVRTRLRYIVQNVCGWREQYDMGAPVPQVFVLKRLCNAQDDVGHGRIRSWWFPRLCTAFGNRGCKITEGSFSICVEVTKRKQQIWPVSCDRLVGAVRSVERYTVISVELVKSAIHRV